ncbi:transposase for insertion sequence [Corynebacterium humireducens NBRC 106098 = DSM 45392]|uniref:Transposase for insertion sequence n=1 Tax=Corynebacterium humireducens NBRC 106098 = DSM 45392 TaxID=1223515 RepID=A0A0B5D4Q9_9CORY|nr:transposase for insertion sequence [Corynebacterium humireducens NBRC 106098 = DSM 45392]
MPRKTYTEQFKRDAVVLYESTPGATVNAIASDLGVNRNSLRTEPSRVSCRLPMRKDHQHEKVLRPRVQSPGRPDGPAAPRRLPVTDRHLHRHR